MLLSDDSTDPPLKSGAHALWGHVVLPEGGINNLWNPKMVPRKKGEFHIVVELTENQEFWTIWRRGWKFLPIPYESF